MKSTQLITEALIGSPTETLADEAARHAVMRRVDVPTRDLPKPQPAPRQDDNQAPLGFTRALGAVLAQPQTARDPLLVEALGLLADAGLVLPTRHLVPLLTLAEFNHEVASALYPVLGARGRWLVDLDSTWLRNRAARSPDPRDWEEGTLTQRVAWICHLRTTDPAAARDLVAAARKEKAADRAKLIAALDVGLGPDDEEFLESLLSERSKEIRHTAAELLTCVEDSAHLDRAMQVAAACFAGADPRPKGLLGRMLSRKPGTLEVTAPTKEDIDQLCPEPPGTSINAWANQRMQALVSVIPPHRWGELGLSVADLIAGVSLDEEQLSLLDALSVSILRWGDVEAAKILVPHCPDPDPDLVLLLSPEERDTTIAALAHKTAPTTFERMCKHFGGAHPGLRLTARTARAVLDHLRAAAGQGCHLPGTYWFLAFASDPHRPDDLVAGFTELAHHPKLTVTGQQLASNAAAALTLRHAIHRSIKEPR